MAIRRFAAVLGLAVAVFTGPARAETLADALVDAYNNSGLLQQNRALLRAADEDVAQSMAALRPIISWQASYTWSSAAASSATSFTDEISASFSVIANLLIYDGGASQIRTEAQKEVVLQTRESLVGIEQDVLLRAVAAYMDVRRNSEFVALRQNNVRLIREELRAAQDRFEVGEVTRTDVSLAEAALAASQSNLAAAQGALAQAVEEFRAAVGRAPGNLQVVSPARLDQSLDQARAYAVRSHPSVRAAQHGVSAAELSIAAAEAALGPSVSLRGTIALDEDFNDTESLGLTVSGPIYSGGQLQSAIRQTQARRDAARSGLLVTTQSVSQGVGNAYAILRVARAGREAYEQQIRASRTAFRGVREEATLGSRTTLDVLNAEQDLLDAQANSISAQADEVVASYQVLAAMGLLTAEHLNLPVQSYDPAAYYNLVDDAPATYSQQGQALDRVLRAIGD